MIRVIYHLIIAGLRHILSLHFSVFIHFEEHWMYSSIMFSQRTQLNRDRRAVSQYMGKQ